MAPKRKLCVDCIKEGVTTEREAPFPGPRCATHNRAKKLQRSDTSWERRIEAVYNITADEYRLIYEHQGGFCYLCRRANGRTKRLSIDHDHRTGVVRGLLCTPCNKGVLGHARDEVEFFHRGIKYLEDPPAVQAIGTRVAPGTE